MQDIYWPMGRAAREQILKQFGGHWWKIYRLRSHEIDNLFMNIVPARTKTRFCNPGTLEVTLYDRIG